MNLLLYHRCPVPLQALTQAVVGLNEAQLQQRTEQVRSWPLQGPEGIRGWGRVGNSGHLWWDTNMCY